MFVWRGEKEKRAIKRANLKDLESVAYELCSIQQSLCFSFLWRLQLLFALTHYLLTSVSALFF